MKALYKAIKSFFGSERGSVVIVSAAVTSVLLMFGAFTVDYGIAYLNTSDAQNAADAAALSAARLLPIEQTNESAATQARNTAIDYVRANGYPGISADNVVLGNVVSGRFTSVRVNVPCKVNSGFSGIFGIRQFEFNRFAKAAVSPASRMSGAVPLGVDQTQLNEAIKNNQTKHIYLKYGGGDGTTGSYGAIDLDGVKGGGANDFSAWLQFGYDGVIKIDDSLLPVEKGNMSGPTADAIESRFNQCTHFTGQGGCTAEHYYPDCPRVLKVLVIEKVGTSYVKVKGFAAFVIEEGFSDQVLGSYLKYLEPGEVNEHADWNMTDFGMYCIGLIE
jgi:hypothetical protein